ncbi:MAG: hypothetical protein EOO85_19390 [Pedobacter sp.]|nr:MAG: hypothetical protein EOO85_19390 [Pedobacter sp.]
MGLSFDFIHGGGQLAELIKTKDWSGTSIGAPESWPESLKLAINISLNSGFPIAIYWGEDFTLLYNDAWSSIPGDKHPWILGKPGTEAWPEIWDVIGPEFQSVLNSGESIRRPDALLLMNRFGYVEECYFDYTLSPVMDTEGKVGGIFNAVIETTYKVINERRKQLLHQLLLSNLERNIAESLINIEYMIAAAKDDIPFSCLYTFEDHQFEKERMVLSTGIKKNEHLKAVWPFPKGFDNSSIYIDDLDKYFTEPISGKYGEPCTEALIVPVTGGKGKVNGHFVLGVSPRKKLDEEYRHFLESVGLHIGNIFLGC